jgi:hypothetical protein
LDLTPGDSYKDAMATRFEDVYTLRVSFGMGRRVAWRAVEAARRAAKDVLTGARLDPAVLRQRTQAWRRAVDAAGPGSTPMRALRAAKAAVWASRQVDLYEFDEPAVAALPPRDPLRVDCFADLVGYRRGLTSFESRRAFLRRAWARLERGSRAYTRTDGADLATSAWVSAPPGAPEDGALLEVLPPRSALVHDLAATPALCHADEWVAVLPQLVRGAVALPNVERALIAVPAGRRDLAEAARRLGGVHVGGVYEEVRGRRRRRWSTIPATRPRSRADAEAAESRA